MEHVSRETLHQLEAYAALLCKWNQRINLIGRTTESELWDRHIWDSYQLLELLPATVSTLADFGSGGGLPGLVLAIARPGLVVTLVERDQRKAAFLTQTVMTLALPNVSVRATPIETIDQRYDVITARALASLTELCSLSYPRLLATGFCLFPKGANFATELAEAKTMWDFAHHEIPSKTHDVAQIISLSQLTPRQAGEQSA